jgi:hypothetical protein
MNWLLNLFTGIPQAAADYFTERMKLKAASRLRELEFQQALHQRKLELISQGLTADMNWEMEFARQAATSWKDEYTLLVVSIPAVMAFIPSFAHYVAEGFAALQGTPAWYQILLGTMFGATVGVRWWRRSQSDT